MVMVSQQPTRRVRRQLLMQAGQSRASGSNAGRAGHRRSGRGRRAGAAGRWVLWGPPSYHMPTHLLDAQVCEAGIKDVVGVAEALAGLRRKVELGLAVAYEHHVLGAGRDGMQKAAAGQAGARRVRGPPPCAWRSGCTGRGACRARGGRSTHDARCPLCASLERPAPSTPSVRTWCARLGTKMLKSGTCCGPRPGGVVVPSSCMSPAPPPPPHSSGVTAGPAEVVGSGRPPVWSSSPCAGPGSASSGSSKGCPGWFESWPSRVEPHGAALAPLLCCVADPW